MSKVSPGAMTVVIFAILFGLGGAFVVRQQLSRIPQGAEGFEAPPAPPPPVYVPVAATDIVSGHTLSLSDISVLQFSAKELAKSPYAGKAFMNSTAQISGRTLQVPLKKGEVFVPDLLYPEGMGPGIADKLPRGYRAVTVPMEHTGAVQGFARPGALVDLLFRARAVGERPEVTITLLERVLVLAVNTTMQPHSRVDVSRWKGSDCTVTFAVTPQQAKILKVVESHGELTMTLRHPEDDMQVAPKEPAKGKDRIGQLEPDADEARFRLVADARGVENVDGVVRPAASITLQDLLGLPDKVRRRSMEIYRGGNRSVIEFDASPNEPNRIVHRGARIETPVPHDTVEAPRPSLGNALLKNAEPRDPVDRAGL